MMVKETSEYNMEKNHEVVLETIGYTKARYIRRLCIIMDRNGEIYNIDDLLKMPREEIQQMINDKLDHPYQRFDS